MNWFVVSINEDWGASLYGPYEFAMAHAQAARIELSDPSGNTVTYTLAALRDWWEDE